MSKWGKDGFIVILTWACYSSFYLCRSNISVLIPSLEETHAQAHSVLVYMVLLFSIAYCAGQFIMGPLSDRFGARFVVTAGMAGSALCMAAMGLSSSAHAFLFCQFLNGLAQSAGWSGLMKMVRGSSSIRGRGVLLGWWSTNYVLGALFAKLLATFSLRQSWIPLDPWRRAALLPATILLILALIFFMMTKRQESIRKPVSPGFTPKLYLEALHTPRVMWLASIYFFVKLIRYSLLFWLPLYMTSFLNMEMVAAGYGSLQFELCGIGGVIGAAYLSDHFFHARRYPVAMLGMLILTGSSLLMSALTKSDPGWHMVLTTAALGCGMFGADSILVGAATQDATSFEHIATVAGIVDGAGSCGQILAPLLISGISIHFGWPAVFQVLAGLAAISILLMLGGMRLESNHRPELDLATAQ